MFMSSVAPVDEKSQKDPDLEFRKTSGSENEVKEQDCGIQNCGFTNTIKYPILILNICGIYVPSNCVCEKAPRQNSRTRTDSDANDANVKSLMFVKCMSVPCLGDHVQRKTCPNADKRWVAVLKRVGCGVMTVMHCSNSLRYFFIIQNAITNKKALVFSLSIYLTLISYFYLMALNSYSCYKHFSPFLAAVLRYDKKYRFYCNFKKLSRKNRIVFGITMTLQLLQSVVVFYGVLTFFDGMSVQMWPLSRLEGIWRVLGAILVGAGVFLAACNLYGTHFLRANVNTLLLQEFKCLRIELASILTNAGESPCTEPLFDQLVEKLRMLGELVDKAYHLIKHTIAASYIFGIPLLCLVLYGVINGSIHLDQYVVLLMTVLVTFISILHTTWTLASLKTQAGSICDVVHEADWSTFSPQLFQKMILLTNMFCTKSFGMSVYGMFVVDWSTFLTVGATLLTYSIVVIQFQIGTPVPACHFVNVTL